MNPKPATALLLCLGLASAPCWAQAAAPAVAPPGPAVAPRAAATPLAAPPADRVEPNVRHSVVEDDGARIDELRVRGHAQRIVVTPKIGPRKSYQILTGDGSREPGDGQGATGKRVWNVLEF
ncbi:MAG: hypothetical protein ABIP61_14800 [Burkholderiaceae bacterium]